MRDHARWAGQVARQEAAARRQYRRVLDQCDAASAKTLLIVLRSALTPAARWWRTAVASGFDAAERGPADVRAAIVLFWDRVNSVSNNPVELYGRKLGEYRRGEKIADLRSPAPRLD